MVETNIRVVRPGTELYLCCRTAKANGASITADALQSGCAMLRNRYGLAAVPQGRGSGELVVATKDPVPCIRVEDDDFVMEVCDSGGSWWRYSLSEGNEKVRELIERAFLIELRKRTKLWSLDSPRKWYEPAPFLAEEGIAAYRRYEVGTVLIEGVGVGIAVDIGTAFISERTVAYFFEDKAGSGERERRGREFDRLVGRQSGQKGTLVYDNGRTRTKCYFEDAPVGVTCGSTGRIRVRGETFDSLFQFYRSNNPALQVTEETPVARVSFRGTGARFVAADRLRIRVMNDELPDQRR